MKSETFIHLLLRHKIIRWHNLLILFLITILSITCTKEDGFSYEVTPNSIIIVPDIQIYTKSDNSSELRSIVNFINENKRNISVCLQTGDLTNNNTPSQWKNVYNCYIDQLDSDILHYECLGNHDYGNDGLADIRVSNIPWDISGDTDISIGDYHENYLSFFNIANQEYGLIVLEFAVRDVTLKWAEDILKQYPHTNFLLLTHAFLNENGYLYSDERIGLDYDAPMQYGLSERNVSKDSKQIFDRLCGQYSNIKYIICGHSLPLKGYVFKTEMNTSGEPVRLLLVNFQHFSNGGNSNIAILNLEKNEIDIISAHTRKKLF